MSVKIIPKFWKITLFSHVEVSICDYKEQK